MNGIVIGLAAAVLLLGFLWIGRMLEKRWGIDPARETPSQDCFDGKDYVPTPKIVVLGHQFSSIAGAGTIVGAVIAASYGWLPALLWVLVGSLVFGAAHDFGALFASLRHKGRSLGRVLRDCVGEKAQRLFTVFALLTLVLLIAGFTNIVAKTFASAGGELVSVGFGKVSPAASAGTASILFVLVALLFGLLVFRKNLPMLPVTLLCLLLMAGSVWAGLCFGLNLPYAVWVGVIAVYIVAASLAPVWSLLQPRDFLSAFLLWGMMLFCLAALIIPQFTTKIEPMPAFTGFTNSWGPMIPTLFAVLAGGAVSGYHALIAAGTTSKQLANEKHARGVSVGALLLDALLAVIAIAAVSNRNVFVRLDSFSSPLAAFSTGIATAWSAIGSGFDAAPVENGLVYALVTVTVSVFALTTLDTITRLARYLFAELFNPENRRLAKLEGAQRFFAAPAVGTILVVLLGCGLGLFPETGRLWGLFGAANLLLAGLAMLAVAAWLRQSGKGGGLLTLLTLVLLLLGMGTLAYLLGVGVGRLAAGVFAWVDALGLVCGLALAVLALILLVRCLPALFKKPEEAADDAD